jgi:hypothetical protein
MSVRIPFKVRTLKQIKTFNGPPLTREHYDATKSLFKVVADPVSCMKQEQAPLFSLAQSAAVEDLSLVIHVARASHLAHCTEASVMHPRGDRIPADVSREEHHLSKCRISVSSNDVR